MREHCVCLRISDIVRNGGDLTPMPRSGVITFGTGDRVGYELSGSVWEPFLRLTYSYGTDPRVTVDEAFALTKTRPHFGGGRWWFTCRGEGCGRRAGILYRAPFQAYFRCRHCHDLTYSIRQNRHSHEWFFGWLAEGTDLTPELVRMAWLSIGKIRPKQDVRYGPCRPEALLDDWCEGRRKS